MKTVDTLLSKITFGACISDNQLSTVIRPSTQVECNGQPHKVGALRRLDLELFTKHRALPSIPFEITRKLENLPDQMTYLHFFRNVNNAGTMTKAWCWLLTDEHHTPILAIPCGDTPANVAATSAIVAWFKQDRLLGYVRTYVANSLRQYVNALARHNIAPSHFTIEGNLNPHQPLENFEAIEANSVDSALEALETTLLANPSYRLKLQVYGHISDEEWGSLPSNMKKYTFSHAKQAYPTHSKQPLAA